MADVASDPAIGHDRPTSGDPPGADETARAERIAALVADLARAARTAVAPCGYLRVRPNLDPERARSPRGERELLLGDRMISAGGATMIDWRSAPLAEAFFACRPGDDYELELGDRELTGTVIDRALIECSDGEPIAITAEHTLRRQPDGRWRAEAADPLVLATRDPALRDRPTSPILVPLDPVQRAAVDLPADRSLLVLGEAGFGKTTVAIHRLAELARRAGHLDPPYSALVLVPTGGLRRLYLRMLDRLGLGWIEVATCDEWLAAQARRLFRDLPERNSGDGSAAVIRLKRHPALRTVLPAIAGRQVTVSPGRRRTPRRAIRDDLFHLFGDRVLLEAVADAADGAITRRAIAEVIAHTKVQFSSTTEADHAHVDADRLVTVDGAAIDAGTPMGDADTIDVEDCAVMFEINRLRTGRDRTRAASLARYRHIVVDEAQELAPIELAVIGRARAPGGVLTIAGDHHQQIDDTAVFGGWPTTLAELGADDAERVTLVESYRCPAAVTALARGLFGAPPETGPLGDGVVWARFPTECHLHAALVGALLGLEVDDPRATVAIVCRTATAARRLEASLRRATSSRLAVDGDIDLEPGVHVTCVRDVKGLEFDYVILPDADAATYPDPARPGSVPASDRAGTDPRRELYVAMTRACHQLILAAVGSFSPLLTAARDRKSAPEAPARNGS